MKLIFILLAAMLPQLARAYAIEAPALSVDYTQNPTELEWKHLTTEHFDVIFPKELEKEAQRVGHLLEKSYRFVTRSLESAPQRIPLILQNQSVESNGFVTLAPRRSELFVTPSIDPELGNTEWLKTLGIHEFRHVVQFQKTRRGFNKYFEMILGEAGQALGLALTLPPWFYEGDAVGIETALTRGGRGRLPLFDRDLRTLLLSGKKWNYDKAHLGSYEDYVPNHYVYGYFYTSWLRNHYGDLFLSKLANHSAKTSWNPLSFYNATTYLTDLKFEKFYESVMNELIAEWQKRADLLKPTPYDVKSMGKRFGWTNYYFPQGTQDGKILALKRGLSFIEQFVLLDGKKERTLFYPSNLQNDYPFKLRHGKFAFFEEDLDPRWGNRNFSRLKVYDLKKEEFILDKRKTKGRLGVINHQGEKVAYIEWDEKQGQSIVVVDLKGEELHRISYPETDVITSIDWFHEKAVVLVIKDRVDLKSVVTLDLTNRNKDILVNKELNNLGFLAVEEGRVLIESPASGIDNIYLVTTTGLKQITSSKYGAYAPTIFGNKLVYNDYSVDGMNVVSKTLPWEEEQKSENSFYPIYEKFAKDENFPKLEETLSVEEKFTVKDYSQTKHAINLHSWLFLAPPLSTSAIVAGYSRDVLNKLSLIAGAQYNFNEQTTEGFVSSTWSHLFPVFDLRAGYGTRRQDFLVAPGDEIENTWEEGTFEAGVQVPWRYYQGRFLHNFTSRAFSRLIKVNNKVTNDVSEITNGALYSPGVELSYSVASRFARRDINPEWAFMLDARAEEGKDITGEDQKGSIRYVEGRAYLPGLWHHHSFYHQLAYEKQRDDFYQYSSFVLYPRGTRSTYLDEFHKYSANYLMPIFYPDYNLSRYLYFKRIHLNIFYDELSGQVQGIPYQAASAGWETIFEMNFLRVFIPFSIGLRGSYIINGLEEENNYEIFLASQLAAF